LRSGELRGGDIPVYGSNGVVGYHNLAITTGRTIVVGRKGSFGMVNYSEKPCWPIDTAYFIDEQSTQEDIRWLSYRLRGFGLDQLNKAAAVPGLNREDAYRKQLTLPPLPEQRRIAAILDKADALRAKRREALAQLDELTQSIFIEMFGDPVTNPKGWRKIPFEEACPTRLGKMLDQKQQTGQHLRSYLRNANVQWFHFDLTEVLEMDFDENARDIFRLKNGDLLICEGGEPGRAAIWRCELDDCYYQKALHRGRPNAKIATPEYLVWLLWFLAARGGLSDHVTAATIAHLTGEKLKAIKIPIPPIDLQHKFVHMLHVLSTIRTSLKLGLREQMKLFSSLQHRAFRGEL
jgi:type I restriction enzyme, S subunit